MPWHCSEIPYIFHNVALMEPTTGGSENAYKMQDIMSDVWVSFAYTGNPDCNAIPHWEPITRENGGTMVLDLNSEMKFYYDEELLDLLNN